MANNLQPHEWHERTDEGKRYYRANWDGRLREWRFLTTLHKEPEWHPIENPSYELWMELRDHLFRKYQRKRLNLKLLEFVDKKMEEMREAGEGPAEQPTVDSDD